MSSKDKIIVSASAISFTLVSLLLLVINSLILSHTASYHTYTNPCDAARRLGDDLNPDDTNNICILTPEQLGFKSTGLLVANGLLGTTVAQTTATANNMTQLEKVDPEVVLGGTTYNLNDDIISLCRHNSDKKTCKQVDSCKTGFDGAYENDAAEHDFSDDGLHGKDDDCSNHKIPDICLFTGFKETNKDKIGLVYTTQTLGVVGIIFAATALTLSTLHFIANLCLHPCGGYCTCCESCCASDVLCCISMYFVDNGWVCTPRKPQSNVGYARYFDSCSQCGALTFLTLWTVIGFLAFTMVAENTILDQCYGVEDATVYGADKTAKDFIESLTDSKAAYKNLKGREASYTALIVLICIHAFFFLIAMIGWGCGIDEDSMDSHDMVQGFSNGLFECFSRMQKQFRPKNGETEPAKNPMRSRKAFSPSGIRYSRVPLRGDNGV
tara:strand:+ start:396 stop:1715 length:1320 start_codon:yes stop_codon:yes gene_type:complete